MGAYNYRALDASGKLIKGVIEADSERQARGQLRLRDLKPVEVIATAGNNKQQAVSAWSGWFQPRISQGDLAVLTRQMATLIQSNMPLDEAITAAAQQARRPKIKGLMLQVRSRVVEGHTLAYALGDFPKVFSEMYRAMVRAGESAGFLGTVMERLAEYTENGQYTQQKLKMAMVYPIILMLVSIAVIFALMVGVVPKLTSIFRHMKTELPLPTKVLIALSDFFAGYWWVLLIGVFLLGVLIWQLLKDPARRHIWHQFLLRVPFISWLIVAMDTARFASTLSILTSSGVPLLEGLKIAGEVLTNSRLREASRQVANTVQEGGSLNRALAQTNLFPPMMVHMVASGEASGELEAMLSRAALNQERELEMTLGSLMAIMEPVMVILMATVVVFIVIAVLLPIVKMNSLVH
ncbi:MAG TPA: type II secretion system inner membrane protein GspF [Spongiibacteraceae bacterium]|nr:type II secretion system inner membrane protein GspF [Spongiibacteraceae bacterium]